MRPLFLGAGLAIAVTASLTTAAELPPAEPDPAGLALFQGHLRELLAHRCVLCHGGDSTESDFDLTTREGLLKGGASGEVVTLGNGSESRLVKLLRHEADPHMPEDGDKLSEEEVAWVVEWLDRGAPYDRPLNDQADTTPWIERVVPASARDFWSFRRFQPVEPPSVESAVVRNAIDQFVVAKQQAHGITANPEAPRRTLIRRAYLDLTGLPPSPDEVEAFLADESPDAFERLIDRLLASPHFGERWGRHWLDVARFAESHGFEHDYDRPTAFHYRDFVIQALNADLPFNTFVRWQLAGDEYEPNNPLAMKATGFLAAGVHATQITKNEVEKHRYDELDDIVSTTTTSMLGLTLGCARCHDHKYDPLPQRDYYQMVSVFTTVVRSEQELNLEPEAYAAARAAYDAEHIPLVTALAEYEARTLPALFADWERNSAAQSNATAWRPLAVEQLQSTAGATFRAQDDGSYLVEGVNGDKDAYTLTGSGDLGTVTAIRIEALPDDALPARGPGRAPNGNFALSSATFTVTAPENGPAANLPLERAIASFEQSGLPAAAVIDADAQSAWAVDGNIGQPSTLLLQLADARLSAGDRWTLTLTFNNNAGHNLGRFRISTTDAPRPVGPEGAGIPDRIAALLKIPAESRSPDERQLLLDWYKWRDAGWQERWRPVGQHALAEPKPRLEKVLISSEGVPAVRLHTQGGDFLEHTHFLKRGNVEDKLAIAQPGYLQVLCDAGEGPEHWFTAPPSGSRTSYRRRALAEWITDTQRGAGHLLARVIVNRLWHHHFGRGIVATPSDFGSRGEPPTDPELLDWLAQELIRNDWRLKPIHKLIMTSAAYRRSSDAHSANAAIDFDNKFVWRFTPRRLEAEIIRDEMLAASGALDPTMFGPGTLDESHRRRSIYFTVKRSKLVPMMLSFDAPDALAGLGRRATTTVAPQALTIMNNPNVRAWAIAFAKKVAPQEDTPLDEAIRSAYRWSLCREPDNDELQSALQFVEAQSTAYQTSGNPAPRATAIADFCQVLFGLNEFAYLD